MQLTSSHDRWKVFRGDSTNSGDLLFSAKRSSMFQCKTTLHVFLANNTREDVCDFKVKGTFSERTCVIYAGDSSTEVAQVRQFHNPLERSTHTHTYIYIQIRCNEAIYLRAYMYPTCLLEQVSVVVRKGRARSRCNKTADIIARSHRPQ
jgi:hypothetical protein